MDTQKVFLILLDISGYTKFIKFHRMSLVHAERIIDELLESVIAEAHPPLVLQEIEGDGVYLYAVSDGSREMARNVYEQVTRGIAAFRKREAELISECSLCPFCEACRNVGRLTLKAILHHGDALFTRVRQFTKLSGEDVILAHRLLKNSIEQKEYILVTENMHALLDDPDGTTCESRTEECRDLGRVNVRVYYPSRDEAKLPSVETPLLAKLGMSLKIEWHSIKRLVMPASRRYRNLEAAQKSGS